MATHTLFLSHKFKCAVVALIWAAVPLLGGSPPALAQQAIYAAGEPIVTGFSGVAPPDPSSATGDPMDQTFIDTSGASMIIQQLKPDGPPSGQVIDAPTVFSASAADIGQVFGIALDDATVPNIYLAATSAYGLDIVVPGSDGNPARSKVGAPNATFMAGMWGSAGDSTGDPGTIWKIDATTGAIAPFATIPGNSGAGLGNIVFDPATEQFFVSDLDNGMIYRLGLDGTIIDSFDHGVSGRPTHNLAAVPDDGSEIDITNPGFNSEDPTTWGFTQPERKVYGLAVHDGRLYYAVAAGPQIWSVGINADGSFGGDPRWELDVTGLSSGNEITNIVFDPEGRMILAQRGPQVGSYDYSVFATPQTSSVLRYSREVPDDPTTPSTWIETPDSYAIGFRPAGENTTGGLALGYGYDPDHQDLGGACSAFLWTTGESLVDAPLMPGATPTNPPATVDGLQGNDRELVRPANDPPTKSYFTEYDGKPADPANAGHLGDVDIWQNCQGAPAAVMPPVFVPPVGYLPPPPNLTLHKFPIGRDCIETREGWRCEFDLRISNTGDSLYWGPLTVEDQLLGGSPATRLVVDGSNYWNCALNGPWAAECGVPEVALYPGESTDVRVGVILPRTTDICIVDNAGEIIWHDGRGNLGRDDDVASMRIPSVQCRKPPLPNNHTNLKLTKTPFPRACTETAAGWACTYLIKVTNTGPGLYNAPIQVQDNFGAPAALTGGPAPWACTQAGSVLTCNRPTTALAPGQSVFLVARAVIPNAVVERGKLCDVRDLATITKAPGGSVLNTNPGDDSGSASSVIPARDCGGATTTDLSLTKTGYKCEPLERALASNTGGGFECVYEVTIKNLGPGNFNGSLSFADQFSPPVTGVVTGPGVTCTPAGSGYSCTSSGSVALTVGQSVSYQVAGKVAAGDICRLVNQAKLTSPAGGTSLNTNPANDSGSAVLPVPNTQCQGTGKLTLTKTSGTCSAAVVAGIASVIGKPIACTFTVTATNSGSGPVSGPIVVKDSPASGSPQITSSQCIPNSAAGTCTLPGALAGGGSFGFNVTVITSQAAASGKDCRLSNTAAIVSPAGGPAASATDTIPAALCGNRPPPQLCPTDSTGTFPDCTCKPGSRGTAGNCVVYHGPPLKLCPTDSVGAYPDCTCRPGTHGTPGACEPNRPRPPVHACPADSTGVYPDCTCKPGTHGTPGACLTNRLPTFKLCPSDSIGHYPDCACKPGTHGQAGRCRPDLPRLPPHKLPGLANPGLANPGLGNPELGNPGFGKPGRGLARLCPRGSVGTYPNCHCPPGYAGRPPRCELMRAMPNLQFSPGLLNRAPERPILR